MLPRPRQLLLSMLAAGAMASGVGMAQPLNLQPVEQEIADTGPLRQSLRRAPTDLRVPSAFDRVYRVPGTARGVGTPARLLPSAGQDGSMLARVSGGLTAVFPASEYHTTKKGNVISRIPAGTVFYIGQSPASRASAAQTPRVRSPNESPLNVSTQVESMVMTRLQPRSAVHEPMPVAERPAQTPVRPDAMPQDRLPEHLRREVVTSPSGHVMTDEQYRRMRIRQMLRP